MENNIRFNSITLAHKYALLLSTDSIYYKAHRQFINEPDDGGIATQWPTQPFLDTFGINRREAKAIAKGGEVKKGFEARIVRALKKFVNRIELVFGSDHPLVKHDRIEIGDLTIERDPPTVEIVNENLETIVGEEAVWYVAKKLGLNRKQAYLAIDRERNVVPKKNCGHMLSEARARATFQKSKGVYFVISPTTNLPHPAINIITMRVSHIMPNQNGEGASIRVKVNVPNIHSKDVSMRYQYRGELIPVNGEYCWTIALGQAPYTVNLEETIYTQRKVLIEPICDEAPPINEEDVHPINLADDMHIQFHAPIRQYPICGLLSSLSQRRTRDDKAAFRRPYSAVVIAACIFDGDYADIERNFMINAIGQYQSLESAKQKLFSLTK